MELYCPPDYVVSDEVKQSTKFIEVKILKEDTLRLLSNDPRFDVK